jgi:hypothetical protein
MEKQYVLNILSVGLYSCLSYLACRVRAPYYIVNSKLLGSIIFFPRCLLNGVIFGKISSNTKFHKNPSSGSLAVPCRQADMTKLMSHFFKFCEMCLTIVPLLSNNDRKSVSTHWNPIQIQHIATCNGNKMGWFSHAYNTAPASLKQSWCCHVMTHVYLHNF